MGVVEDAWFLQAGVRKWVWRPRERSGQMNDGDVGILDKTMNNKRKQVWGCWWGEPCCHGNYSRFSRISFEQGWENGCAPWMDIKKQGKGGETENKRKWLNREKKPQKIHFMDHQWIFRVGEWTTSNVCMIPRYFAIEARCIKINNGKHEFKIIYQQATSGLHQSTPSKPTNIQISKRDMEER